MSNAQLKHFYDAVYTKGEKQHYTQLRLPHGDYAEEFLKAISLISWEGKNVLDVGCGTGVMCSLAKAAGAAKVTGIDFAPSAIEEAKKKYPDSSITFLCGTIDDTAEQFDVIMSFGTLEHMDDPLAALRKYKNRLHPKGSLISTSPNWLNPRGYVLQTLWHLFHAPITLADLHYLTPLNFEEWALELGMDLDWCTVEHDWGNGMMMINDFKRRLPNVVRDGGLGTSQEQIDGFIQWLETRVAPFAKTEAKQGGAVGVYHFKSR